MSDERAVADLQEELVRSRATIQAFARRTLDYWDLEARASVGKRLNCLAGNLIGEYRDDINKAMGYTKESEEDDARAAVDAPRLDVG